MVAIVCSLSLLNTETLRDTLMNCVLNTSPNCQDEFCTNGVAYFVFGILVLWHEDLVLNEIASVQWGTATIF